MMCDATVCSTAALESGYFFIIDVGCHANGNKHITDVCPLNMMSTNVNISANNKINN